jgi:hypothetical protein
MAATEYAKQCINGVETCVSREFGSGGPWNVVENQNSHGCNMATPSPCPGSGTGLGGRRRRRRVGLLGRKAQFNNRFDASAPMTAAPMFDYVVKEAANGSVHYYGAIVDGDNEILIDITPQMFTNLTGEPDVYSIDGVFRYRKPRKEGIALRRHNRTIATTKGYTEQSLQSLLDKSHIRETALAFLLEAGIPVADENDLFEVFTKFHYEFPFVQSVLSEKEYNSWAGFHTQNRNDNHFDWGGLATGIAGFFSGMLEGAQGAVQEQLATYVSNYANYMQTDFAAIQAKLAERGPQAALDAFMHYKNGSWKELTSFIQNFVGGHGLDMPAQVTQLIAAQNEMENDLRTRITSGQGTGGSGGYGTGGDKGNAPGAGMAIDPMTIALAIGALVVLFMIMKK